MVEPSREQLVEALVQRDEVIADLRAVVEQQADQIRELTRRLDQDSTTSSRPPSSDNPYRQGRAKTSTRGRSGRKPGKQPGAGGASLRLIEDPDEMVDCRPQVCSGGHELAGVVGSVQRRQVVDLADPPPPHVTEYRVHTLVCPDCRERVAGQVPVHVTGRVQYGPRALATAAEVTCAHYVPVARAAGLLGALTGLGMSTGTMATVRSKAAGLVEDLFLPSAFGLLTKAGVLHVDETPAKVAGALAYVHTKTTETVTVMNVGDRSAKTIDADGVLEEFTGTLVRDGYVGYEHLTKAVHAWCGAHLLRDLAAIIKHADGSQVWAQAMYDTLIDALRTTTTARTEGHAELTDTETERLDRLYTGAFSAGISQNTGAHTTLGKDALRLATRFRDRKDMIFRFTTDLAVPFTNNAAERDLRPVKVQQRTSGGAWRTLQGLADFAMVRSYLLTATKNGVATIDALIGLFRHEPYLPATC